MHQQMWHFFPKRCIWDGIFNGCDDHTANVNKKTREQKNKVDILNYLLILKCVSVKLRLSNWICRQIWIRIVNLAILLTAHCKLMPVGIANRIVVVESKSRSEFDRRLTSIQISLIESTIAIPIYNWSIFDIFLIKSIIIDLFID